MVFRASCHWYLSGARDCHQFGNPSAASFDCGLAVSDPVLPCSRRFPQRLLLCQSPVTTSINPVPGERLRFLREVEDHELESVVCEIDLTSPVEFGDSLSPLQ